MSKPAPPAVLVVDDSPDYRRIVGRVLASGGYEVLAAASAEEARGLLASRAPDAAVLDWNLPGSSGLELSRWMRERPGLAGLPVVILSVNSAAADQARGLRESEASAYMTKPFAPEELLARLRSLLERRARGAERL